MANASPSPLCDSTDPFMKHFARTRSHDTFFLKAITKGIPLGDLLLTRFPYLFPDAELPPSVHLEFTDACTWNCVDCASPSSGRLRHMMGEDVFGTILANLDRYRINRVCLGGGEPTLHPKFIPMLEKIRARTRFLTLVSKGQWRDNEIASAIVEKKVDLVEISVEAGGRGRAGSSQSGIDYEQLKVNLENLKAFKRHYRSNSQINIRLIITPSTAAQLESEKKYWSPFCDVVTPRFIARAGEAACAQDLHSPGQGLPGGCPKCTWPFKNLQIGADGQIFLCPASERSAHEDKRLQLGSILESTLKELWNSPLLKTYRNAHRTGQTMAIPACKDCKGSQF